MPWLDRVRSLEAKVDDLEGVQAKRAAQGVVDLEKTVASIIDPLGPLRTLSDRMDALEEWRDSTEQVDAE